MGFVLGVLMAARYNLAARWIRGLESTESDAPPAA